MPGTPVAKAPANPAKAAATRMRFLKFFAWLSFTLNTLIIATGGAVRLTGSGLGCDQWPTCTGGSITPTAEMGIHGIIEFANRTITHPLLITAIVVLVLTYKLRKTQRGLFVLAWITLGLILLQAFVGGVVVWNSLPSLLVGFHYTASLIIVCVTAAYLVLLYQGAGSRERAVPLPFAILTHICTLGMAIIVFSGVLTTGAGPHSGDAEVIRSGFDASALAHLHALPGYITFGLVLALLAWALKAKLPPARWFAVLLLLLLAQIAVGVYQARNGLPVVFVGIHMVLAALSAAAMTVTVMRLKTHRATN